MLMPIPYAADRPLKRFPAVTLFIVGLNCAVFVLSCWSQLDYIVDNYGLRAFSPELATLFTSLVLHASATHLLANTIYLWLFGCQVEDALGRLEFLLFYIGSGITGNLVRILVARSILSPTNDLPAVGASGALAGVLGVFAIRFYRARIKTLILVPWNFAALPAIGVWVGVQIAYAVWSIYAPRITDTGCWAHVGGFTFGVISGLLMSLGRDAEEEYLRQDAQAHFDRKNAPQAVRHYEEYLRRKPADHNTHFQMARALCQLRQYDRATQHANLAVSLALHSGDTDGAAKYYTDLQAQEGVLDDLPVDPAFRVACVLEGQHRLEEAARAYEKVYSRYPDALEAQTALLRHGDVLVRMEHHEEAAAIWREYLERYPDGHLRAQAATRLAHRLPGEKR